MRLSQLMAQGSGNPSSEPTSTSELIPRTVRVIGAQVTEVSTAAAAFRVTTHTGRLPAGGPQVGPVDLVALDHLPLGSGSGCEAGC